MNTFFAHHIKDLVVICESMLKETRPDMEKSRIRHIRGHLKDAMYIAEGLDDKPAQTGPNEATGPTQPALSCTCPMPGVVSAKCPVHGTSIV